MVRKRSSNISSKNCVEAGERPPAGIRSSKGECLLLFLLSLLVLFIYSNTLDSPFIFDDKPNIQDNPQIRLSELTLDGVKKAGASSRPVAMISFALNYYFHQYNVLGYHLVNILIHITTGILLYLFVGITLKMPSVVAMYGAHRWIPFFTALLWLVHPTQTQSVTYVVQRMNSMAAMFYLLSLLLYAKARLAGEKRKRWLLFVGSGLSGLLALGSKQTAATLPVFVLGYEWYFFQGLSKDWLKRHLAYLFGITVFFAVISLVFLGLNPLETFQSIGDYSRNEFTFGQRVLTQFRVVIYYLSLLFYPLPSRLNLDYDFPLSLSLISPLTTLLSAGAIVGIIGLACCLARKERLISFCILWFLGNLVIESSVIPLAIIFEHRTYLPSMLVSLVAVALAYRHINWRWGTVVTLCAMVALCSAWTFQRNSVWSNDVALWSDCVRKSPSKARPHNSLGAALARQGKLDEAMRHYSTALEIDPDFAEPHCNLGTALAHQGRLDEAISHFLKALEIKPDYAKAHNSLGTATARQGRLDEAISHFLKALEIKPDYAKAHNNLGSAFARQGKLDEAISHFTEALKIKPDYNRAMKNLRSALADKAGKGGP
ncbi:MAG: tetratricopeptide repeat protein [Thermodesulfobacteriota bacterium]|nr:tetratricopeptide repeat protein [Thermodesulfobacteriota bacterium]